MKFPPRPVGTAIRAALDHHGYTASELARQIGMYPQTLSNIINHRINLPCKYVSDMQALLPSLKNRTFERQVMEQYYK